MSAWSTMCEVEKGTVKEKTLENEWGEHFMNVLCLGRNLGPYEGAFHSHSL